MNKEEFIKEIEKLNIEYDENKLNKLEIYKEFLIEYNKHTNLTRITSEEDMYLKHFYDSLTISKIIDLNNIDNLLDVGSGAGFPGMVLKIFYPNLNVTLIDSNNKKTTFLKELAKKLNVDVEIINDRVEEFAKNNLNKYSVVTSRAVANLRVLSEISLPLVKENGYFIPMKGKLDIELEDSINTIELMNGKIVERKEFNLYKEDGTRNIILIKKIGETYLTNLREYDKIVKKPLKKNSK